MPIEIRELVIKTSIVPPADGQPGQPAAENSPQDLEQLKRQLLQECQRIIQEQLKRRQATR